MPAHMESSVASISARSSGRPASRPPTMTEIAASPCQPSTIAPQSMEIRSPSASTREPGMPCTTSSLTDVQSAPVKPW